MNGKQPWISTDLHFLAYATQISNNFQHAGPAPALRMTKIRKSKHCPAFKGFWSLIIDKLIKGLKVLVSVSPAPHLKCWINSSRNPVTSEASGCPLITVRGRLIKSGMTVLGFFPKPSFLEFEIYEIYLYFGAWNLRF